MKKINKTCFIISFLFSTLFINFNVNAFGMFDYNNYQGQTTGYTFEEDRENYHDDEGKDNERNEDDKYIRFAKIGEVQSAVNQLDSYLTWRDCKTALIYFVKRKDFIKVLENASCK